MQMMSGELFAVELFLEPTSNSTKPTCGFQAPRVFFILKIKMLNKVEVEDFQE